MKFFAGIGIVTGCIVTGYLIAGGKLGVLWQPAEFIIILGAAIGAFVTSQPADIISHIGAMFSKMVSGSVYHKKEYLDLLKLQFHVFKLARSKGMLALESHIENPKESDIFSQYPTFLANHAALDFLCDYLRLITMGSDNPMQMEDLMDLELEIHHQEEHAQVAAIQSMADGMPALGIVAAVLGVIITMGSIDQPPAILGYLIGAALVGTFFGIAVSYGYLAPWTTALEIALKADSRYVTCLKTGLVAYMKGLAPILAVEYARKSLEGHNRPTFAELEEATQDIKV